MADVFDVGETVICSIEVRDENDALQDPATSMNIAIDRIKPDFNSAVSSTAMTPDSTGKYHYDFASAGNDRGIYQATFTATDASRITIEKKEFTLE